MKKILFTGFEPFGGETVNPSWEAVRLLPDEINGAQIIKARVCVEYARSEVQLKALIREYEPDIVVCCGQAGGRRAVTPEVCAINRDHADAPDNAGEVRRYSEIIPGGEGIYFAKLPVEKLVENVKAAGIPCAPSFSAGTYVCNHIYYTLRTMTGNGLFVHVPYEKKQIEGRDLPALDMEEIAEAIKIIAETLAMP